MNKISPEDIQKIRNQHKLTQEEFAYKVGVTLSTIHRWEKGKSTPSKLAMIRLTELKKANNDEDNDC